MICVPYLQEKRLAIKENLPNFAANLLNLIVEIMKISNLMVTALMAMCVQHATAYETPTMGWSSWNTYGFKINEQLIQSQADAVLANGLDKVGYKYINIDDGYFGGRDSEGNLLINAERFPNGLAPLVEYIHSKGLKAGIYSDAGRNTCASYFGGDKWGIGVGLYGHDQQDMDFLCKILPKYSE